MWRRVIELEVSVVAGWDLARLEDATCGFTRWMSDWRLPQLA